MSPQTPRAVTDPGLTQRKTIPICFCTKSAINPTRLFKMAQASPMWTQKQIGIFFFYVTQALRTETPAH